MEMKYFKYYLLSILIFLFLSCQTHKNTKEIANLNGTSIFIDDVDSIANKSIYEIRKEALKTVLKREIIEIESNKRDISVDELITLEVKNKTQKISFHDFERYLDLYNLNKDSVNRIQINLYLQTQKEKERYDYFTDSLLEQANLKIALLPHNNKQVNLEDVKFFNLTPENNKVVYIISDFDCPSCRFIESKLEELIKSYYNSVNFRYIYYSDYVSQKALAIGALAKQKNINDLHSYFYKCNADISRDEIIDFVDSTDVDLEQFQKDMANPELMIEFLKTKEKLIENEIYSTPTFIVNSLILDDELAIYNLEYLLENEICNP
jgi:thiol-disulfide isomerase/thioredoxin